MKVGVLQFFSWPGRRGELKEVYDRAIERVHIMDQNGYDAVWIAEHHFSTYSVCPSINMMGTWFAANTRNLRIGTGVSLAAFYNPLRLAEEVALLDVLSGGRVNWGAGRGFDPKEFSAFGVNQQTESYPRFRETVEIVLKAWNNERLSYSGEFYEYEDVLVLPKPLQQPHPPVWMAASSPPAVEWAGKEGYAIMMDPHSPMSAIAEKQALYRDSLAAGGHSTEVGDTPVARLLAIAPTEDEARRVAVSGAQWTTGSYAKKIMAGERDPIERYVEDVILWGTPERVADMINSHADAGHLNYLLCAPLSQQSFTLFNEAVLPRLM